MYRVDHRCIVCMSTMMCDPLSMTVKSTSIYVAENNGECVLCIALIVLMKHGEQTRRNKRDHEQGCEDCTNKEMA